MDLSIFNQYQTLPLDVTMGFGFLVLGALLRNIGMVIKGLGMIIGAFKKNPDIIKRAARKIRRKKKGHHDLGRGDD